ncbi:MULTISPECIES: TIGR03118 family protein [unclassified Anaeromyxobacter]|uniref:TIGR03118 family protein n=1 Tax=unclassified Anaeromyxobacter TaxID=2620896 RepID=UPI001F55F923|nr:MULTISPECIES: TIGR03118 family protein [unclassified Anaeromyxobacter]
MKPQLVSKHPVFPIALLACAASLTAGVTGRAADEGVTPAAREALGGLYVQRNLVSDGAVSSEHLDANLVNAWGITHRGASPWWVSDNGAGVSTLYDGEGIAQFGAPPLVVSIAGAGGHAGSPTGVVGNTGGSFEVSSGGAHEPAFFIFASEDGTLSAWNPKVPPPVAPAIRSTTTVVVVDDSLAGAVYKGLTLAATSSGDERLYATDFHGGAVRVFDGAFKPVATTGGFRDPTIPAGYAPFGIRAIGGTIYVTYALQDADRHDDVPGQHHGYVNAFTPDGELIGRVASRGKLDSPWGIALAPASGFGRFGGKLLVGNFGDGHIIGYSLAGDASEGGGAYLTGKGGRITIEGLWGLDFGNDGAAGPARTLFFAAGPDDESAGLFGRIDFVRGGR